MRAAIAVPRIGRDRGANLSTVRALVHEAGDEGADLVLFPETALTGFLHSGVPAHDYELAVTVPSAEIERLSRLASDSSIHLGIGVLEREDSRLYDSALLFGPDGRLLLKYRRISRGWHRRGDDPDVYRHGSEISVAHTDLGKLAFLICGDITDDTLLDRVRALDPDWLLLPMARGFDDDVHDEQEWETSEIEAYGLHAARACTPTLLANYVGEVDGCFGGAVIYDATGSVLAKSPLHQPGLLVAELSTGAEALDRFVPYSVVIETERA